MYIERKEKEDGSAYFLDAAGRIFTDIYVFVDGKKIASGVLRADSSEGWVDVEIPVLGETSKYEAGTEVNFNADPAFFSNKVERYIGQVKILVPTN